MEKLQFILHENVERFGEDGEILPDRVSTIGFKFTFGGKQYGDYTVINKPTVTTQDIMEALEDLCPEIEMVLKELQADTNSI